MPSYQYRDSCYKGKTVSWPSYHHNVNDYTQEDGIYIEMDTEIIKGLLYSFAEPSFSTLVNK